VGLDARPFPAFPSAADLWADASAWPTGHWLTGRLGGVSIEGLIAAVLADVGFAEVEFRAVAGHVDGFVVDRRMSPREALEPILAAFGVDALDVGTAIRFAGRDRRVDAVVAADDLVEVGADPTFRLHRAQESELPAEVSVTFSDALLEHRRTTVTVGRRLGGSRRASSADLAVVAPIEAMCGVAEGWLADLWAGRGTVETTLDPTRVAIEPATCCCSRSRARRAGDGGEPHRRFGPRPRGPRARPRRPPPGAWRFARPRRRVGAGARRADRPRPRHRPRERGRRSASPLCRRLGVALDRPAGAGPRPQDETVPRSSPSSGRRSSA
jgi:hypothetical protein